MSMLAEFREITPSLLDRIKGRPSLVRSIVGPLPASAEGVSDTELLLQSMTAKKRAMMEAILAAMPLEKRAHMDQQAAQLAAALRREIGHRSGVEPPPEGLGEGTSTDNAWHGLHFLLAGSAEPAEGDLSQAVLGGIEIGEDIGYGPARYLDVPAVRRVAGALAAVPDHDLRHRYDAVAMEDASLYPGGWHEAASLDWLLEAFSELKTFYQSVAVRGNAVLLYLT